MTCSQIWLSPLVDKSEFTSVIFFFGEISQPGDTNKGLAKGSKSFVFLVGKNGPLSPHYEEMFFEVTIFRN
jgi:hypothetical protein